MCADKAKLDGIPYRVIKRLPSYRAALVDAISSGADKLSSNQLAALCGGTASQVRQDLSHFGSFGQQGYGYVTRELLATIDHILGIDAECHLAIVGVGQLGRALLSYPGFTDKGFR
ncbi:MAG: winged-helix domain-containing protein, partial [Bacillota bacterium]